MDKLTDQDLSPGITERPLDSEAGVIVGGIACALGQVALLWLLTHPAHNFGAFEVMCIPVAVIGFIIGGFGGSMENPIRGIVAAAILSSLAVLGVCAMNSPKAIHVFVENLFLWAVMILLGGLSGGIGGFVNQWNLRRKLGPPVIATAVREKAEQLQAEKETAQLQAENEVKVQDRCLSCGHMLESCDTTCPECGWTYQ